MEWNELPIEHCPRGDEVETLQFALDRVRQQFAWKTGGLTAEQLRQTHPPSTMTLAGLIKHMAFVEDGFTGRAAQQPLAPPWDTRSWVENDRCGWESAGASRSTCSRSTSNTPDMPMSCARPSTD
jgi:hypothetical protein